MSAPKEEKRLVYVSKSLVDKVMEEARRQGTSISKLVEDSIRYSLQVLEAGYSLDEALEILRAFRLLRVLGGTFTPKPVLECIESGTCRSREEIRAKWRESGRAYGIYLRERHNNPLKALRALLEASRWDLGEVTVERAGSNYKLRCVSASLSEEETLNILELTRGALEGLGCRIVSVETTRGIVLIEFELQKQ